MKSKSVSTVVFLLVITFFMGAIMLRFFTRQVFVKRFGMENVFTDVVFFDAEKLKNGTRTDVNGTVEENNDGERIEVNWTELYPLPSNNEYQQGDVPVRSIDSLDRYVSAIESVEAVFGTYATDYLPFRQNLVGLSNRYESIVKWDYVSYSEYNPVVTTADGYLTSVYPRINVGEQAESTASLAEYCDSIGVSFSYVSVPSKVCEREDMDLCGELDFSNQNADDFIALIEKSGVRTLDLRKTLHEEGLSHHSLFFHTDHHWTPQTGLWASERIAAHLQEECGMYPDMTRVVKDSFITEVYPDWFLGSQGKKVTLERAMPESFALLHPTFDTSLHYEVKSLGLDAEGDFSILYDMDQVVQRDYYGLNPYGAYIYSDQPLETIENYAKGLTGHVLVVHDSFGNVVVPFLAMAFQRVDSIDLRHFNGSLRSYISTERPEAVLLMYNAGMLGNSSAFDLI